MRVIGNLLGGLFFFVGIVIVSPFLLLWYCVEIYSMKFGRKK